MIREKLKEILDRSRYETVTYTGEATDLIELAFTPEDFKELQRLANGQAESSQKLIQGVWLKPLVTHTDERGFFREIIRVTDDFFSEGFGQWSHSRMNPGVVKAWHLHWSQVDWWHIVFGEVKAVLYDCRKDSPTFRLTNEFMLGDGQEPVVLKIPPGVAHGLKALTPAHLFYITSRVYDPEDEGRIPYDDPVIGYDWLKGPEIK